MRLPERTTRLGLTLVMTTTILTVLARPAPASWGSLPQSSPKVVSAGPPDQTWLTDLPERQGTRPKAKVAVFEFKGDDVYQPVRGAVVQLLRRRGFQVTASLRPVDSALQYRELSHALSMGVFVQGEISGSGARQVALIHLYSGLTGRRVASIKFSGTTPKIVASIGSTLWARTGPTITRTCTSAARPRRRVREPLRIEAGTPVENSAARTDDT